MCHVRHTKCSLSGGIDVYTDLKHGTSTYIININIDVQLNVFCMVFSDKDTSAEADNVSKGYSCMICDKMFITQSKLKQHLPSHTGDKPFQCEQCDMRFPYASSLRNHRMAHVGVKPFECSQCDKKFASRSGLRAHVRIHASKTFGEVDKPNGHQQSHMINESITSPATDNRDVTVSCPVIREDTATFKCLHCNKCFVESSRLKKHMFYHDREKPFTCEQCSKSFAALDTLLQHVERQHSTEKIHQCENCDKRFASRSSLKYHRMTHRMRFGCDVCGRRFSRSQRLKTHLALHESKKVYEYDLDDNVSDIADCLQMPMPSGASEKPYGCDLCDKKFTHLRELDWHRVIHAGENKFECMLCNKKFPKSSKLKRHFLVHTGEKPHSCEECSKRFATTSDLKRHQRRRCCGMLHTCSQCDSAYTQAEQLEVHMETHRLQYNGEPVPASVDSVHLETCTATFPGAVHCPSCGVKFEDVVSRDEHSCRHLGENHVSFFQSAFVLDHS